MYFFQDMTILQTAFLLFTLLVRVVIFTECIGWLYEEF